MASKILNKSKPKVEPPPMKDEPAKEAPKEGEEAKEGGEESVPTPAPAEMDVD